LRLLDDGHVHPAVAIAAGRRGVGLLAGAVAVTGALLVPAPAAEAVAVSLVASTPVALAGIAPHSTAAGSGTLTPVTTSSWTLQASATNAGHMTAAGTGCTNSEPTLASPLQVTVAGAIGGLSSAGAISLSGSNQTVATGSSSISAGLFTTTYSQPIATTETLLAGCLYSITVTYTLQ
jgi:hypothetical protein